MLRRPRKSVVLGPPICRGYTADVGHAFSKRTYFRACGQFWLSFVQRAPRVAGEKKIEEEEESR